MSLKSEVEEIVSLFDDPFQGDYEEFLEALNKEGIHLPPFDGEYIPDLIDYLDVPEYGSVGSGVLEWYWSGEDLFVRAK